MILNKRERRKALCDGHEIVNPDNPIDMEWYYQAVKEARMRYTWLKSRKSSPEYNVYCLKYRIWANESFWCPNSPLYPDRESWNEWCNKKKEYYKNLDPNIICFLNADER